MGGGEKRGSYAAGPAEDIVFRLPLQRSKQGLVQCCQAYWYLSSYTDFGNNPLILRQKENNLPIFWRVKQLHVSFGGATITFTMALPQKSLRTFWMTPRYMVLKNHYGPFGLPPLRWIRHSGISQLVKISVFIA